MDTVGYSRTANQTYSMEDHWLWYLTGSVDTIATFRVTFQKDDRLELGYNAHPEVSISRPEEEESFWGMMDEYCEENSVQYRMHGSGASRSSAIKMSIENPESIKRFIEPIIPGFIQQREQAKLMLEKIVPLCKGDYRTKEGLYKLAGYSDELRELSPKSRSTKYTQEYFKKEWGDEIET